MKYPLLVIGLQLLAGCSDRPGTRLQPGEGRLQDSLKQCFSSWQRLQIAQGHFYAADSCHPGWFARPGHTGGETIAWGFPEDSAGYRYSYADVNTDGRTDQLVTFVPAQCDGGNGSMWTQVAVFTVSEGDRYRTVATTNDGMAASVGADGGGFYHYDSIAPRRIHATFYHFDADDGHCCPGVRQPVVLDYATCRLVRTR